MTDFFLVFPDEVTANAALFERDEDLQKPKFQNIDILGHLYQPLPDPLPTDYTPVEIPGWHVNVRAVEGEDTSALEAYAVQPANPRRVWA